MESLNPLDIIIFVIIGYGMYKGSQKGLFGMSTSILAIIVSVILGFRFRKVAETLYLDYLNVNLSPEGIAFAGFATAFVVSYLIIYSVLRYLTDSLAKTPLKIDQALGAVFGGSIAVIALSIVFFLLSYVGFPSETNKKGSIAYPFVQNFSKYSLSLVPKALKEANKQVQKYGNQVTPLIEETTPEETPGEPSTSPKPRAIR